MVVRVVVLVLGDVALSLWCGEWGCETRKGMHPSIKAFACLFVVVCLCGCLLSCENWGGHSTPSRYTPCLLALLGALSVVRKPRHQQK